MTIPNRAPCPVAKRGCTPASWLAAAARLADAVFETDLRGDFTAFGDLRFLGLEARPLLGTAIDSLFADPGGLAGIIAGLRADGGRWQGQVTLRRAGAALHPFHLALALRAGRFLAPTAVTGMLINLEAGPHVQPDPARPAAVSLLCPETSLWLLASFTEQAARRFDRLDIESRPGTLTLIGFGVAAAALHTPIAISIAGEMLEFIRPTDLLGRISPTIIALWCDGMDHLTGAERATRLCKYLPTTTPGQSLLSLGLATRWPGSADDPEVLLTRAIAALHTAEAITARDNTASWFVWQSHHKV